MRVQQPEPARADREGLCLALAWLLGRRLLEVVPSWLDMTFGRVTRRSVTV
jgi:hypothetical protein